MTGLRRTDDDDLRTSNARWAALAVSILFLICCSGALNNFPSTVGDDVRYFFVAKSIAEGDGYRITFRHPESLETRYPPVFLLMLASVAWASPDDMYAAKMIPMLFGVASVVLTFIFFRTRFGERRAAAIAVLTAVNPLMITFSTVVLTEVPLMCLCLLTACVAHRFLGDAAKRPGKRHVRVAACIAGAVLTRVAGLGLLPAAALWLAFQRRWREGVLVFALSALFVSPWFMWSSTRDTHTIGHFEEAFRPSLASAPAAAAVLRRTPVMRIGEMADRVWTNVCVMPRHIAIVTLPACFVRDLGDDSVPFARRALVDPVAVFFWRNRRAAFLLVAAIFVLIAMGCVRAFWRGADLMDWFGLCYSGMVWAYAELEPRFLVPLIPLLYSYLMAGMALVASRCPAKRPRLARIPVVGVVVLAAVLSGAAVFRLVRANLALPPARGKDTDMSAFVRCYGPGHWARVLAASTRIRAFVPPGKVVAWPLGDAGPCYYFSRRRIREVPLAIDVAVSRAILRDQADYLVLFGRPEKVAEHRAACSDETFALVLRWEGQLKCEAPDGWPPCDDSRIVALFEKVPK